MGQHDIVFEDLHGDPDNEAATVDLDVDDNEKGITRRSADADDEGATIDLDSDDDGAAEDDDSVRHGQEGGEGHDEDDGYSKKVKARIQRATRSEKKAKQEADYWRQQALDAKKKEATLRKTTMERSVESLDEAIESTEAQLESAFEEGDSKVQAKLTSKLSELRADRKATSYELDNWEEPDAGDISPDDGRITPEPDKKQRELVSDWVGSNDDWYGAKGFERHTRLANRIDKEVYADGYDPGTPEYYEELDARVKAKMPEIFDDDTEDDAHGDSESRRSRRQPVAPVDGSESSASRKRRSSSRVELDARDFANMRKFGLDPNDPSVLKEYAASKREAERGLRR